MSVVESTDALFKAIRAIATACDGAVGQDGLGFSKYDAELGHGLAVSDPTTWSSRRRRAAWVMLRKYRRQLARYGINYDLIPEPKLDEQWRPGGSAPLESRKVSLTPDKFVIRFSYDASLVAAVKRIPGHRWEGETKQWTIPRVPHVYEPLLAFLRDNEFRAGADVHSAIEELVVRAEEAESNVEASKAADADFLIEGLGGELRPFQRAGVAYAVRAERCFIADEMGLGKTVQALACIQHWQAFPALIVCPASLKLNWAREARKWIPGRGVKVWDSKSGWPEDINIINYDILARRRDRLGEMNPKIIVFDEAHYLKTHRAQRTKAAEALAKPIRYRLALTGTPVLNRPNELVAQLSLLGRLDEFGGYWSFVRRYCSAHRNSFGLDTSGARNLEELNHRLRSSCFIRRNKIDVLKELPPKQRSIVPLTIENRDEYQKAEHQLIAWLHDQAMRDETFEASLFDLSEEERQQRKREHAQEVAEKAERAEQLVRIEALKKLAARGKMEAVSQWVEDFLESGEKLVLFAHHVDIVQELGRRFNAPTITGQTDLSARQAAVDRFQTDPTCQVISLNLQAGGVGLTLTAASNVAFVELGWTPALHDQAEDRCHRIGQLSQVNAWYLLAENTIDMEIQELIDEKRVVVTAATDGRIEKREGGILGDLIQRLKGRE